MRSPFLRSYSTGNIQGSMLVQIYTNDNNNGCIQTGTRERAMSQSCIVTWV